MPRSIFTLLAALLLTPLIAWSAEPILTYERVHAQVAHEDNAVRLTVFDDGHVEAHFPFYTPNAGRHSWHISPVRTQALLELAAPLREIRSGQLMQEVDFQRTRNMTVVTDPDRVTIELHGGARNPHRISAPSPEIWASMLPPDHSMRSFADIADHLSEWMRREAREIQP